MDNNQISKIQHDALREYINDSESRNVIDAVFCVRMSKDIAKKFDSGLYDNMVNEHKKCLNELTSLHIKYPSSAKPIFYMYIVPDDRFVELLEYPYKERKGGGRPVPSYDIDGFNAAYGTSQNLLIGNSEVSVLRHINLIHEYAHLIQHQFCFPDQMLAEGFAELIPWYVLEYEQRVPEHLAAVKLMDRIYTANELLGTVSFGDVVPNKTCAFQTSYMSSYLFVRTVVEQIRFKFNLSRIEAVQKFLEILHFTKYRKQFFIVELAGIIGSDVDKLLNSNEYQIEMLKQIKE